MPLSDLFLPRRVKQLASNAGIEYWIYQPGDQIPRLDILMHHMLQKGILDSHEGQIFSDIRLHVGMALKTKNPHAFRPDIFDEHAHPTDEEIRLMAGSESVIKARYYEEGPFKDERYLRVLPRLAAQIARVSKGTIVYDFLQNRFFSAEEFLRLFGDGTAPDPSDLHVRGVWNHDSKIATSVGLKKIGLPEIQSITMDADSEVLVHTLLSQTAQAIFDDKALPEKLGLFNFDQENLVTFEKPKKMNQNKPIITHFHRVVYK